jgi:hypothetical protein
MTDIKNFSATAASNSLPPPDGFPEGQAASTYNNSARELMAAIRRQHEQAEWIDLGDVPTYISGTSFSVPNNRTAVYQVGRRIRIVDGVPATFYGTITASVFGSVTTVTVALDSGAIAASVAAVAVGLVSVTNSSVSSSNISGTIPTAKIADGGITPAKLANSGLELGAFRNKIINGSFDIWQGGASLTPTVGVATYTADQWISFAAGAAVTVSQSAGGGFTTGTNCLLLTGAASNTYVDLTQRFEAAEVQKWRNGNVTVTARVYNGKGSTITANSLPFTVVCPSATDNWTGGADRLVTTFTHAAIPNASWGQVSVTFNPSAYGDIDKGMQVTVRVPTLLAGQTFKWSEFQLESGGVATPFEQRSIPVETFLCQRYFYQFDSVNAYVGTGSYRANTTTPEVSFLHPVPMRVIPTITMAAAAFNVYSTTGAPLTTSTSVVGNTLRSGWISATVGLAVATQGTGAMFYVASGQTITVSARL